MTSSVFEEPFKPHESSLPSLRIQNAPKWGIYLLLISVLLQFRVAEADSLSLCSFDQIHAGGRCIPCPNRCPPGQSLHQGCKCKNCSDGFYSSHNDRHPCSECPKCPQGREELTPCNGTHPTVCKPCPNGTYVDKIDGTCKNCSSCCSGWLKGRLEADCVLQGMPDSCGCRQYSCAATPLNSYICASKRKKLQATPPTQPPTTAPPPPPTTDINGLVSTQISSTNQSNLTNIVVEFEESYKKGKRRKREEWSPVYLVSVITIVAGLLACGLVYGWLNNRTGQSRRRTRGHSIEERMITSPAADSSGVVVVKIKERPPSHNPDYKKHTDGEEGERTPFMSYEVDEWELPKTSEGLLGSPYQGGTPGTSDTNNSPYSNPVSVSDESLDGAKKPERTPSVSGFPMENLGDSSKHTSPLKDPVPVSEESLDGAKKPERTPSVSGFPMEKFGASSKHTSPLKDPVPVSDESLDGAKKPEIPSLVENKADLSSYLDCDETSYNDVRKPDAEPRDKLGDLDNICTGQPLIPVGKSEPIQSTEENIPVSPHNLCDPNSKCHLPGFENNLAAPISTPVQETQDEKKETVVTDAGASTVTKTIHTRREREDDSATVEMNIGVKVVYSTSCKQCGGELKRKCHHCETSL